MNKVLSLVVVVCCLVLIAGCTRSENTDVTFLEDPEITDTTIVVEIVDESDPKSTEGPVDEDQPDIILFESPDESEIETDFPVIVADKFPPIDTDETKNPVETVWKEVESPKASSFFYGVFLVFAIIVTTIIAVVFTMKRKR